ncbi:FMN-dependent dehydrogenase domain-containing protein [Sarocladium implicatum]|nr:FMN-dependent dehydrogenase domain-containing protein [Sarocladium implicatum]
MVNPLPRPTGSSDSILDCPVPDLTAHANYQRDLYSAFRPPRFPTSADKWESLAKAKVPAANFGYVCGSAGAGNTDRGNLDAFNRYRLRPRMLVNATRRDVSVELFGTVHPSPFLAAPVGVQSLMHADAEEATAKACLNVGMPMILSTAATRTIEEVASANANGHRWFQLYWPKPQSEEITASLLNRAKAAGFKVLVVTLDTFSLGWRPTDLDQAFLPFIWGTGCQIGFSDPAFNELYDRSRQEDTRSAAEKLAELWSYMRRPGSMYGAAKVLSHVATLPKSKAWLDVMNSGTYREWAHLEIIKRLWAGPIVLKGILSVHDAQLAIDHGMHGIIVSNHGGRQQDGAIAALDALAEITADEKVQMSGLTILFDSGIRNGADALKALALGAKAVCVGRPYMYGLGFGGQAGVEHVFRCLLADLDNTLGLIGKKSARELTRTDLWIAPWAKL